LGEEAKLINYIVPVKPKNAAGLVAPIYSQIKRDFGRVVEPFLLHSPLPELLAGAWMACRETEVVGNVPREIKEAVAAVVSMQNQCPYCVDAHTIMLAADGEGKLVKNLKAGNFAGISDPKIKAVVEWTQKTALPKMEHDSPPFTQSEAPEIIGTIVYFHYIKRMANILLSETPLPSKNPAFKGAFSHVASWMFSTAVHSPKTVGDSLGFLPETPLPTDLSWAAFAENVSGAFARFSKAVEIDGEYALPIEVRMLAAREIGKLLTQKEVNSTLIKQVTAELNDPAMEAAAQLTLKAALAPSLVDEKTISMYRQHYCEDTKLLGALAWASFAAARKIGLEITKT
jgi:AhpD family alkylhydroperoxidase